ncbi:MAG TPA: YbaY family lipoprotein [Rhodanobacteraceae bacterium]
MRNLSIVALATLVFLGGCNAANQNQPASGTAPANGASAANGANAANAAANAPIPSTVSGSVTLKDPVEIGQGGKLDIKLVDVSTPDVPIAEKALDVSGNPPFNFSLDIDPAKIDRKRIYTVNAVLTDGERRFLPALTAPVLTGGSPATAQITLSPEPTAAEKLKDEYAKLQGRIGGMKAVTGTYTTDDASVGWDAFAEHGKVVFVRVNTEYDKGGRTSVKYAFKDDKPMFVKQQGGATLGWDDNGGIVVNEKQGGGEVGDKDITAIHDQAAHAFQMAQEKVDAQKKR